jgi:uncharacterized protein YkwD
MPVPTWLRAGAAALAAALVSLGSTAALAAPVPFVADAWFTRGGLSGTTQATSGRGTAPAPQVSPPAARFTPDAWYSGGLAAGGTGSSGAAAPPTGSELGGLSGGAAPGPAPAGGTANLSAQAQQVLAWTNATRAASGLPPLREDPLLDAVALTKCQDMVALGYFGHVSPTYGSPLQMQQAFGVRARIMGGENLAGARTVALAYFMLVHEPGHLANILYPGLTEIGVAVVPLGGYGVYVCQEFAGN